MRVTSKAASVFQLKAIDKRYSEDTLNQQQIDLIKKEIAGNLMQFTKKSSLEEYSEWPFTTKMQNFAKDKRSVLGSLKTRQFNYCSIQITRKF